jgi:hypothetical protein
MSAITPLPSTAEPPGSDALTRLGSALLAAPATPAELGPWRWAVRQHLVGVRDLLAAETSSGTDGWLAARGATTLRRRDTLLGRVGRLGSQVLEAADVSGVRRELARLVVDVQHHRQRLHDLAYDEVALELGGED